MAIDSLKQGIKAVENGQMEEGARLLRLALRDDILTGKLRATAYMWLAQTDQDFNHKLACFQQAQLADPDNPDARAGLEYLYSQQYGGQQQSQYPPQQQFPTQPPRTMPGSGQQQYGVQPSQQHRQQEPPRLPTDSRPFQSPQNPYVPPPQAGGNQQLPEFQQHMTNPRSQYQGAQGFFHTVGILGGPNGQGTGFFVSRDGLLVTTRHVVGGEQDVAVELTRGSRVQGRIVRTFPELDIALIRVHQTINQLLMVSNNPVIQDNQRLVAVAYDQPAIPTVRRHTQQQYGEHWFPTDITEMRDAGGNPILDQNNYLVGMLTRNATKATAFYFGLHINMIFRCVEFYIGETNTGTNRVYCPSCGYVSQAAHYGAFYCENCGSALPHTANIQRYPQPQTDPLYRENMSQPCTNPSCGARVGYYKDRCLRCGETASRQRR